MVKQKSSQKPSSLSRIDERAAETDRWVKLHLAKGRETIAMKNSKLKALRLAEAAASAEAMPEDCDPSPSRPKRRMRQIWVSGGAEDKSARK